MPACCEQPGSSRRPHRYVASTPCRTQLERRLMLAVVCGDQTPDLHFCMYDEGLTQDKVGLVRLLFPSMRAPVDAHIGIRCGCCRACIHMLHTCLDVMCGCVDVWMCGCVCVCVCVSALHQWLLSAGNFACLDGSTPCESDPVIINGLAESLDAAARALCAGYSTLVLANCARG